MEVQREGFEAVLFGESKDTIWGVGIPRNWCFFFLLEPVDSNLLLYTVIFLTSYLGLGIGFLIMSL